MGEKKLSEMIRLDLKRAGIPYKTAEGFADFHAAGRHTYITQLLRFRAIAAGSQGTGPAQRCENDDALHPYRHRRSGQGDREPAGSQGIAQGFGEGRATGQTRQDWRSQMRCISGGVGRRVTPNGTEGGRKNGHNPLRSNGFGSNCRRLSLVGESGGQGIRTLNRLPGT